MTYDDKNNQWLSDTMDVMQSNYIMAVTDIISKGYPILLAGTVMVYCSSNKRVPLMMFQTLEHIPLTEVDSRTFIAQEPGSLWFLTEFVTKAPSTTFKNCRMPTIIEFLKYQKNSLV